MSKITFTFSPAVGEPIHLSIPVGYCGGRAVIVLPNYLTAQDGARRPLPVEVSDGWTVIDLVPKQEARIDLKKAEEGVNEGLGRIGGVGERKDRGEMREEPTLFPDPNPVQKTESIYTMQFKRDDGYGTCSAKVIDKNIKKYGHKIVEEEMFKASLWCEAGKSKRKTTVKGIDAFIHKWLESAAEYRQEKRLKKTGSLIEEYEEDQIGF
jgi:hypothetical protein